MPITRLGLGALTQGAIGLGTFKAYCSTGATMVVGTSTAAHSATSSYLGTPATLGLSTMDSGYPTISAFTATSTNHTLTYRATFTGCQANAALGEIGIYNATASGTDGLLLNRYPDALGTKTCAQSWQLSVVFTLTT
jgi:hypothetical protein